MCLWNYGKGTRRKIFIEGREVNIKSPIDAIKYGIGMFPKKEDMTALHPICRLWKI